jgi:galactitol-specific phosphotransferase system IIB component
MKKIGLEMGLNELGDYLKGEGYSVEVMSESIDSNVSKLNSFDAIVTTDQNTDMLGYSDTETKIPVINASGLTPMEIKSRLDRETSK